MIPDDVATFDLETLVGDAIVGMDLTRAPDWVAPEIAPVLPTPKREPTSYSKTRLVQWHLDELTRMEGATDAAHEAVDAAIAKDRAKALKHWRDGSLDPVRARIALITVAAGEGPVHVIECAEDEQAGLVEFGEWAAEVDPSTWVAHKGRSFDVPMLQLRAMRHGLYGLARRFHQDKPWDGQVVDTLDWWPQMDGRRNFKKGTLDDVCDFLGIDRGDNPITGAEVLDAYVRGDWDDVVRHGVADVVAAREVYRVLAEVRGVLRGG